MQEVVARLRGEPSPAGGSDLDARAAHQGDSAERAMVVREPQSAGGGGSEPTLGSVAAERAWVESLMDEELRVMLHGTLQVRAHTCTHTRALSACVQLIL